MQHLLFHLLATSTLLIGLSGALRAQAPCFPGPDGTNVAAGGGPCINTVVTAVPFLRINPDARGGAMGDAGVALSPDANALHYNASRLAFSEEDLALSATYTPWLQALGLNDVYLAYLSGFKRFGDGNQAVGASLRYFSLGDIQFTDDNNQPLQVGRPNEFEFALSYTRRLTQTFGISITGKYINSNLAAGQQVGGEILRAGQAVAADLGFNYRSEPLGASGNILSVGAAITNIGNKINYSRDTIRDFIPTNLAIGAAYTFNLDQYNQITVTAETNKLLVPTPCDGSDKCKRTNEEINDLSPVSGILTSFNDAPDGFGEELREFTFSVGAEYWYAEQFAVRAGYFHEDQTKGGRRYITTGLGLKYNIFGINLSYLVPTGNQRNPLDNTLRFSLLFDFGANAGQ